MTIEMMMRMPPMVGVPAFFWWLLGPSSRMYCPIWNCLSLPISHGPRTMHRNSAVMDANAVRIVTYRKTRNGLA